MTMTPQRLAKLDAVMAKLSEPRPTKIEHKYTISDWCGRIEYAKYALADAYPDLRAHIDAQAATIARLTEANGILERALRTVGDDYPGSSCQKWCRDQLKAARAAVIVTGAATMTKRSIVIE